MSPATFSPRAVVGQCGPRRRGAEEVAANFSSKRPAVLPQWTGSIYRSRMPSTAVKTLGLRKAFWAAIGRRRRVVEISLRRLTPRRRRQRGDRGCRAPNCWTPSREAGARAAYQALPRDASGEYAKGRRASKHEPCRGRAAGPAQGSKSPNLESGPQKGAWSPCAGSPSPVVRYPPPQPWRVGPVFASQSDGVWRKLIACNRWLAQR